MSKWSLHSLETEGKKELIKNMALAYPGHFIMPWTLYFLTDISSKHPWTFYSFLTLTLINSAYHFILGVTYPLSKSFLGEKRWDRTYLITVAIEAISFTLPVLYFQKAYGIWSPEFVFTALLWVVGLEGFAKFCYHFPNAFRLCFGLMVAPLLIYSPLETGYMGLIFALSVAGYSQVVYQGAMASYKQSISLYETSKRAVRDELKLKDLLTVSSFTIFEINKSLDIADASRAPYPPQVHWYLPNNLRSEIVAFKDSDLKHKTFELFTRLEKEETWYQFNLRKEREGETVYMVALDIHQQKLLSLELEEQKAMQISNSKLAALGEMAGGIAHEVNNPLTILSGNIYKIRALLKKDQFEKDSILNSLGKMDDTIKRISRIINGLRNLSHPGHASMEKTLVSQILQDTLGVCQEKFASKGVTLNPPAYSSFFSSTYVAAGHVEVGQVLLNLINNAFDIIENQEEKEISIRVEEHESTIAFKVVDNGPGAPNPEKLFLPFYTTKDVGRGTGLGLSLSRKIAESHKGTLTYSREENKTVFTLCLPKWRATEKKEDPEGSSSSQAA